ncbi:uncharacterized protein BDR25DRAFT_320616 [Lindgomyces ingoldianus]|uniref:Uncharacterized protein n=1 Tax=Lindgomyces ingoldianus TaxID=673940 RepID=A0ACB6Q704_9PLEO|nr:uncharacterized protein BDR25DRAFT_320616 [Lindgomyces ingoldianus]KAF2462618.1 hypothetical protein BDR25DRAFT_320616 [Lindgomyces ingoldianus]
MNQQTFHPYIPLSPGAGKAFDNDAKCMRRFEAYPNSMQTHKYMPGPHEPQPGDPKPKDNFVACTGAKTRHLLNFTMPNKQLKSINSDGSENFKTSFATLSIGGNDIGFSKILRGCLLTLKSHCDESLANATNELYCGSFFAKYNNVLTEMIEKRFHLTPDADFAYRTWVYQTSYSQFFEEDTTQCNKASFLPFGPYATQELRKKLNRLTQSLNYVLQYWIDMRNVHWTLDKSMWGDKYFTAIDWVNVDWVYTGHRFCREGVNEPNYKDPDTWFYYLPIPRALDGNCSEVEVGEAIEKFTWEPDEPGEYTWNLDDPSSLGDLGDKVNWVRTFHPNYTMT